MTGFNSSVIITNPNMLFGRNTPGEILDQLIYFAKSGTNIQIQGERRSGKTSTLRCFETLLFRDSDSIIPIYLNFKEEPLIYKKNTDVYRYVLAKSISVLFEFKGISYKQKLLNGIIKPHLNYRSLFKALQKVDDFLIQGILEDFFFKVNRDYRQGFILLIDEFEYLFRKSFENPNGFFVLRAITEKPFENEIKPLSFIIAGTQSWDNLCTLTGSLELNNLGASILFISPLCRMDFDEMWNYTLKNIKLHIKSDSILFNFDNLFNITGGVPFYAKYIGETILSGKKNVNFTILKKHFEELYLNLTEKEIEVIYAIIKNEHITNRDTAPNLVDRGILKTEGYNYKVNGIFLEDFFFEKLGSKKFDTIEKRKILLIEKVSIIQDYIYKINNNRFNRNKCDIFNCSNDETQIYKDLEKPCLDSDGWSRFCKALYLNQFERTKANNKNLFLLPIPFQYKHEFVKIIDISRHIWSGHKLRTFKQNPNQATKNDALMFYIGSIVEPSNSIYFEMQLKALVEYAKYLHDLNEYVECYNY